MNIFEIISIISFVLSTYLTVNKIYSSRPRIIIDTISVHPFRNMVFAKIAINNLSDEPAAITQVFLSNNSKNIVSKCTQYPQEIFRGTSRTNGVITSERILYSEKMPINIPRKSALSFLLAFPIEESKLNDLCSEQMTLEVKSNGKIFIDKFDFILKNAPKELLEKEAIK